MSVILTPQQVASVKPSSTRYAKDDYRKPITAAITGKKSLGKIEDDFPGVKPANVAYQLKQQMKPDEAKVLEVARTADFGVVLVYKATA